MKTRKTVYIYYGFLFQHLFVLILYYGLPQEFMTENGNVYYTGNSHTFREYIWTRQSAIETRSEHNIMYIYALFSLFFSL